MTEPHASKNGRTAAAQAGEHEEGAPPRGQARVVGQQAWFTAAVCVLSVVAEQVGPMLPPRALLGSTSRTAASAVNSMDVPHIVYRVQFRLVLTR